MRHRSGRTISAERFPTNETMNKFIWPIRVYYEDTDAGGVVFYANYLRYLERARTEWLRDLGFEQDTLMVDPGIVFAVRRTEIDYLLPARFNEVLQVVSSVTGIKGATLVFDQEVQRETDGAVLCKGLFKVACLQKDTLRPVRIPVEIRQRLTLVTDQPEVVSHA